MIRAKENHLKLNSSDESNIKAQIEGLIKTLGGQTSASEYFLEHYGVSMSQYSKILEELFLTSKFDAFYRDKIQATDKELKDYYDKNSDQFNKIEYYAVAFRKYSKMTKM